MDRLFPRIQGSYSFPWLPTIDVVLRTCYDWDYRSEYRFVGFREIDSVAKRWDSLGRGDWANGLRQLKVSRNHFFAYCRTIYEIMVELAQIWTNPDHPVFAQLEAQGQLNNRDIPMICDMLKQDGNQLIRLLKRFLN